MKSVIPIPTCEIFWKGRSDLTVSKDICIVLIGINIG